jgi:hypothetical protein
MDGVPMSGYAKRMMEAAKPWMEANPEPFAGRIRLPQWLVESRFSPDHVAELRAKVADFAKYGPDEQARASGIIEELIDSANAVADWSDEYETILNKGADVHTTSASFLPSESLLAYALGSWFLSWGHHNYNVFDLSSDFVAAMLLTDPEALSIDTIRLPFRGILMLLPDGFARDSGGGSFTKVHVCEVKGETGDILDITASNGHRILSTSAKSDAVTLRGLSAFGSEEEWGVDDDQDRRVIRTLQCVVLGLVAYTSCVTGAAERRVTRRGSREATSPTPTYWDVGRTVRIDPNLVRAARSGSREIALRLKYRHIVRGHYRNQAVGPGRKERRSTWIAPFWKGPEDGAKIVHTYKPQTSTEP